MIAGEAERIWPQFCADLERGVAWPLYRGTGEIPLAESPTPRFDLLQLDLYSTATLQFSRGCPYRCDFCDIIVMFGRKPRCKSPEQIGRELDLLRAAGVHQVFFVDDNLIGHRPAAKELLRFLRRYQDRHGYRFFFGTEASLNLAQDEELLRLFREANFGWVFIGIETPDPDSLKETRKIQNTGADILGSVRRISAEGIEVLAGFIVGFDNDTLETFERQYGFITASGVQAAMVGLLTALPRTPLYRRLEQEGRLRPHEDDTDNTRPGTNIVPKRMAYDAMVDAYQTLYRRLLTDRGIAARILNKLRHLKEPVAASAYPLRDRIGILWRLLCEGILPGGPDRIAWFMRTPPWRSPKRLPVGVTDWITGLAMREYVERRFGSPTNPAPMQRRALKARW